MLAPHDIESLRRSHAMAPLAPKQVEELLEYCDELARRHDQVRAVLADLPTSFGEVRASLNRLSQIVDVTGHH